MDSSTFNVDSTLLNHLHSFDWRTCVLEKQSNDIMCDNDEYILLVQF